MSRIFINNSELNLGKAEKRELHGRNWIVAPMTMLKEGIYNGSGGPIFYPASENKKSAKSWNHMPIVIDHPQDAVGNFISAKTPEVLEERGVGMVLATNAIQGDLKAEAWFDILRLEKVQPQLLEVLNAAIDGTPPTAIEVSTGLHLVPKEEIGVWNNLSYSKVASDYEPDHLAVLLNTKGSCTVEAGCGLFVNSQAELDKALTSKEKREASIQAARRMLMLELSDSELVANEACFSEIEDAVRILFRQMDDIIYSDGWVEAVFADRFIFRFRHKLYEQGYQMEGSAAKLVGTYKEVIRRVEYDPASPVVANSVLGNTMEKSKIIAAILTTNGSNWTEADKPTLESMSEEVLTKIHANLMKTQVTNSAEGGTACGCTGKPAPTNPTDNGAVAPAPAPVTNAGGNDNWWAAIPSDQQVLINDALKMMNDIRSGHINTILADPTNKLTANTLNKCTTEELAGMSALVTNSAKAREQAAAASAEAAAAREQAAKAAANVSPFIDYRVAAPAPTPVTNAANSNSEAPKFSPLRMLSTFPGN